MNLTSENALCFPSSLPTLTPPLLSKSIFFHQGQSLARLLPPLIPYAFQLPIFLPRSPSTTTICLTIAAKSSQLVSLPLLLVSRLSYVQLFCDPMD